MDLLRLLRGNGVGGCHDGRPPVRFRWPHRLDRTRRPPGSPVAARSSRVRFTGGWQYRAWCPDRPHALSTETAYRRVRRARHTRQVFGLEGVGPVAGPTGSRFPGSLPVLMMTAVVPSHRCGTVPDSHRIPSCASRREATRRDVAAPSGSATNSNRMHRRVYHTPPARHGRCVIILAQPFTASRPG